MTTKFRAMQTQEDWKWIWDRAHPLQCRDTAGIVAYDDETGKIQAACVFDSFTIDACSVHFAIDNPFVIRSGFLHEVARHLFINCDRKRIFGLIPSNNEKAHKLDLHIGFREVARIPDAYAEGVDYIVVRMDRETSRWLEPIRERKAA